MPCLFEDDNCRGGFLARDYESVADRVRTELVRLIGADRSIRL